MGSDPIGMPPPNLPPGYEIPDWETDKDVQIQKEGGVTSAKGTGDSKDTLQVTTTPQSPENAKFSFDETANLQRMNGPSAPPNTGEEATLQKQQSEATGGNPINGARGMENPFFAPNLLVALYTIMMKLGDQMNRNLAMESQFTAGMVMAFSEIAKDIKEKLLVAADKTFNANMIRAGSMFGQAATQLGSSAVGARGIQQQKPKIQAEINQKQQQLTDLENAKPAVEYNTKLQERTNVENQMKKLENQGQGGTNPSQEYQKLAKEKGQLDNVINNRWESKPEVMAKMRTEAVNAGHTGDTEGIKSHAKSVQQSPTVQQSGGYENATKQLKSEVGFREGFKDLEAQGMAYQANRHITDGLQAAGSAYGGAMEAASAFQTKEAEYKRAEESELRAYSQTLGSAVEKGGQMNKQEYENFTKLQENMQQISQQTSKLGVSMNP